MHWTGEPNFGTGAEPTRSRRGLRACWLALALVAGVCWAGVGQEQQRILVRVRGSVVDDATGELIERFGVQTARFLPDSPDVPRWAGGSGPGTPAKGQFAFSGFLTPGQKIWARIIADGYEPTTITPEPIVSLAGVDRLVVRLRRGASVTGQVLDHLGNPVKDATVYLAGRTPLTLENRRPAHPFYDTSSPVGPGGRFTISGVTFAEEHLVVVSKAIQAWVSPLPKAGEPAVIRLPEPARFEIGYSIAEGEPEATFALQYRSLGPQLSPGPGDNARVDSTEMFKVKSGSAHTMELAPGAYLLTRTKSVTIGSITRTRSVDPLPFGVDAGKEFRTNLNRTSGFAINGKILGMGAGIERAFVTITTADAAADPRTPAIMKTPAFDFLASGAGGAFRTETLKPNTYTVLVEAYLPGQNIGAVFLTGAGQVASSTPVGDVGPGGWPVPALFGSAKVTVPAAGPAPAIQIEVKPVRK